MIYGKTVYILGAGASEHAGIPLLSNFMDKAEILFKSKAQLDHYDSFERVFSWIYKLRRSASAAVNLSNLEDVFSLLNLQKEAMVEQAAGLYDDLCNIIFETIDQSFDQKNTHGTSHYHDSTYTDFLKAFRQCNAQREQASREGTFRRDSIITLNYDVILDSSFELLNMPFDYCLAPSSDNGKIKFLKLHGSMNWATHPDCRHPGGKDIQVFKVRDFMPMRDPTVTMPMPIFRNLRMQGKCQADGCHVLGSLRPVFLPPTWSKTAGNAGVGHVWQIAIEELKTAEQIVIVGYSMPEMDGFFKYLLTTGLEGNEQIRRTLVVDPNSSIADRFRAVLPRAVPIEKGTEKYCPKFADLVAQLSFMVYGIASEGGPNITVS